MGVLNQSMRRLLMLLLFLSLYTSAFGQIQVAVETPTAAASAPGAAAGSTVSMRISNAQVSSFVVNIPSGFVFQAGSVSTPDWNCTSSGAIVCSPATTSPVPSFTFALTLPGEGSFADPIAAPDASGSVIANQSGGAPSNAVVFYTVRTDIVIVPPSPAPLGLNQTATLTFDVSNSGGPFYRFRQTRVNFLLPADLGYVAVNTAPWSCTDAGNNVSCLFNQTSATSTPVSVPINLGVRRNTLPANATSISYSVALPNNDPNSSNNTGSVAVPVPVQNLVDLRVSAPSIADQQSGATLSSQFSVDALGGSVTALNVRLSQLGAAGQVFQSITSSSAQLTCAVSVNAQEADCVASSFAGSATITLVSVMPTVAAGQSQANGLHAVALSGTNDPNPANNSADVNFNVVGPTPAALTLTKTASASEVNGGSEFSYTIDGSNTGGELARQVVMVDELPTSLSLIAIEPVSIGANCTALGNRVECAQTQLSTGERLTVRLRVRAPVGQQSIENSASIVANNAPTATARVTTRVVAAGNVDLAITKSASNAIINLGADVEYVLRVENKGTIVANNVVISDDLPASLSLVSAGGIGYSCNASSSLRCTRASLAAGAISEIRIVARPLTTGVIVNFASVAFDQADSVPGDNTDSESITVQGAGELGVDGELSGPATQNIALGSDGVLNYVARNRGAAAATCSLVLSLTPQSGPFTVRAISSPGATCSHSASSATCSLILGANAQAQIGLTVGSVQPGSGSVNANLICPNDATPGNNQVTTSLNSAQSAGADLAIQARDSADPVRLSDEFNYNLTVTNFGPGGAQNVLISAVLPAGVEFLSATGATCTGAASNLSCALPGALAASGVANLIVRARASAESGQITARFSVSSSTADAVSANNSVQENTQINPRDTNQIVDVINPSLTDQFARDAAPVVADICTNPSAELAPQCEAIIDAALDRNIGALESGLRAIFPEEVLAERLALIQQSDVQFNNIDTRLNEVRTGGGSGLSLSGLNLIYGRTAIPFSLLKAAADEEPEVGGSGDLVSPWGFFINGTYSRGDQTTDPRVRKIRTDFDNIGLTAGVDYRLSARTVLGAALGFSRFDSDLGLDGENRSRSITFTGYGTHSFTDRFYADARLSFGTTSFDSVRNIRFNFENFSIDRTAVGDTDARQIAFSTGMGYNFQKAAWSITPNANFRYLRSRIDGYTETGAGANNVAYSDQTVTSLQYTLGVQVSRAISMSNGVFVPQFDLGYSYESRNADFALTARLLGANANSPAFTVRADDPDKGYGNVGVGFVYVAANGRQAYLNYRRLFANDSVSRDTINLGARFEF